MRRGNRASNRQTALLAGYRFCHIAPAATSSGGGLLSCVLVRTCGCNEETVTRLCRGGCDERAVTCCCDEAAGCRYCHKFMVVHRDLKVWHRPPPAHTHHIYVRRSRVSQEGFDTTALRLLHDQCWFLCVCVLASHCVCAEQLGLSACAPPCVCECVCGVVRAVTRVVLWTGCSRITWCSCMCECACGVCTR